MRRAVPALLLLASAALAQTALTFPPPKVTPPDKDTRETLDLRRARLTAALDDLRRQGVRDPYLADAEVYLEALRRVQALGEFYPSTSKSLLAVADRGLLRAAQLARGESPWLFAAGQTAARAYRSRVDGSLQPYAVTLPHDYGKVRGKRYRVDVVLHGRDASLTEVSFLHLHRGARPAPGDLPGVRIDVFGRGNNGYRWAGEADVFEAVEHFFTAESHLGRGDLPDAARVVLRGFSMGGAGTWHIGLHRPDQFIALAPGAGFTVTRGYVPQLPGRLPDYQEACLSIYDAADYAENVADVPVVAYSGGRDPQIAAARAVEKRLAPLGLKLTHLVAPDLGHEFPAEWQKKVEAEISKKTSFGRVQYPPRVRFVTYTLRYPSCYWVELLALDRHYAQARVTAERLDDGFAVQTANVRALRLALGTGATREPVAVAIDGQKLAGLVPHPGPAGDLFVYLEKASGKWSAVRPERVAVDRLRRPRKGGGVQGPIDDAFAAPFLCVRGTGKPWHPATEEYAEKNLERFAAEWAKFFRGTLPVKADTEVTAEDVASKHLVLFGDPSSNSLIEQVVPRLPLTWSARSIEFAGARYDAATHVPVMVYPSPLAAGRYVVLNSGHTFRADDLRGTNALLYPRLGDYAVLRLKDRKDPLAVEVKKAGLFTDDWALPAPPR